MKEIGKAAGNQHYQGAAAADNGAADGKETRGMYDIFDRLMVFSGTMGARPLMMDSGYFRLKDIRAKMVPHRA